MSKKAFLAHSSIKQAFINLPSDYLIKAVIQIEHADGDADYTICKLACLSAATKPTAVVAEDSDIFQLMVHHADKTDQSENLYIITSRQTVCITTLKMNLDPGLSDAILFLHAFLYLHV